MPNSNRQRKPTALLEAVVVILIYYRLIRAIEVWQRASITYLSNVEVRALFFPNKPIKEPTTIEVVILHHANYGVTIQSEISSDVVN